MPNKKSVSFDTIVLFFMKRYNIPSKKDIEKLMTKLDHLEAMVKQSCTKANGTRSRDLKARNLINSLGKFSPAEKKSIPQAYGSDRIKTGKIRLSLVEAFKKQS
jgi:hypothetical protein